MSGVSHKLGGDGGAFFIICLEKGLVNIEKLFLVVSPVLWSSKSLQPNAASLLDSDSNHNHCIILISTVRDIPVPSVCVCVCNALDPSIIRLHFSTTRTYVCTVL